MGRYRSEAGKKCKKTRNEATTLLKTKEVDLERTQTRSHQSQVLNHLFPAIMNKKQHMHVVGFVLKSLSKLESVYWQTFPPKLENWMACRSQKTEDRRHKARLTNEAGMWSEMSEIAPTAPTSSPELEKGQATEVRNRKIRMRDGCGNFQFPFSKTERIFFSTESG
jgi:hypothetical protein